MTNATKPVAWRCRSWGSEEWAYFDYDDKPSTVPSNQLEPLYPPPAAPAPASTERLLQDETQDRETKGLNRWFSDKPNARQEVRDALLACPYIRSGDGGSSYCALAASPVDGKGEVK